MNMNELADMFSRMRERYADAEPDSYNAKFIEHDIGDMALRELEVIIKALRFAADMERLGSYDVEIKCLNPGDEWSITAWRRGMGIEVSFKCIYTAARKAVEALEEGE